LVRPIGSAKLEFIVTVAGPAAPALITLALMPVLLSQSAILIGFTIISAAHVATLAVPSGDGAILRRCIGH
jgi:hypothetical protein